MSLAIAPAFPAVKAVSLIVGAAYSEVTSFIIQRPIFGAVWTKAQTASTPKEVIEAKESQTAAASLLTSAGASLLQSYGVNAILHLANVLNYKGAAIVGSLLFFVRSGPQLVRSLFITKDPIDVVASSVAVSLLNTVGLSLALQAYNQHFDKNILSKL